MKLRSPCNVKTENRVDMEFNFLVNLCVMRTIAHRANRKMLPVYVFYRNALDSGTAKCCSLLTLVRQPLCTSGFTLQTSSVLVVALLAKIRFQYVLLEQRVYLCV